MRFFATANLRDAIISNLSKRGNTLADGVKFTITGNAHLKINGAFYSEVADPYEYTRAVPQAIEALDALDIQRPNGGLDIPLGKVRCKGDSPPQG